VVPTASSDVQLTAVSGPVTIDTGAVARSLDCTGYTGTLTHTAGVNLFLGDATAGAGNIALRLVAGMTYTLGSSSTSAIFFASTSATQQTIISGGKTLGSWTINNGGSYVLGDANTVGAAATVTLQGGTFSTNNFALSIGLFALSTAAAKTLTLGSSATAITGTGTVWNVTGTSVTFTANTAVVTFTGNNAGVATGSFNYNGMSMVFSGSGTPFISGVPSGLANLTRLGVAGKTEAFSFASPLTITGTFTVTGNSTVNRVLVNSNTIGTSRAVSAAAVSFTNVDFSDIAAAGAAIPWTGTSMGDALGNSNITFDAPTTQTHTASAGGNWSDITKWTSRVPLPQDNVVVDVNTTGTLTADMPRLGADVTFAGFAGTASSAIVLTGYGSIVLGSGMTMGWQTLTLSARSAKTITSNGKAFSNGLTLSSPNGTYTLSDALNVAGNFATASGTTGTFLSASFPITVGTFSAGNLTTVTLGTSTVSLTTTTAAALILFLSTGVVLSAASAIFVVSVATANARNITLGGKTVGTITYTVAGSTGSLTFNDGGTINTINFSDASNARSLLFTAATTTTITNFNVFGTPGKLMTIDTAGGVGTHTLVKVAP
jgi:hypothetical protein